MVGRVCRGTGIVAGRSTWSLGVIRKWCCCMSANMKGSCLCGAVKYEIDQLDMPTNINVLSNVTKSLKLLGRPGSSGSLHGIPDLIQGFEPGVGRSLVSNTSPNSLLHIQSGLIGGQIVQLSLG